MENTATRGTTVRGVKQSRRIERLSLEPLFETGRRQHGIEPHRQIEPVALGEERIQIDNPDFLKRRRLDLLNERGKIEIASVFPGSREDVGHEGVFGLRGGPSTPASDRRLVAVLPLARRAARRRP